MRQQPKVCANAILSQPSPHIFFPTMARIHKPVHREFLRVTNFVCRTLPTRFAVCASPCFFGEANNQNWPNLCVYTSVRSTAAQKHLWKAHGFPLAAYTPTFFGPPVLPPKISAPKIRWPTHDGRAPAIEKNLCAKADNGHGGTHKKPSSCAALTYASVSVAGDFWGETAFFLLAPIVWRRWGKSVVNHRKDATTMSAAGSGWR